MSVIDAQAKNVRNIYTELQMPVTDTQENMSVTDAQAKNVSDGYIGLINISDRYKG